MKKKLLQTLKRPRISYGVNPGKDIMKAFNIRWDAPEPIRSQLPKEIEIPKQYKNVEAISRYVSDQTGYSHLGFAIKYTTSEIKAHERKCKFETLKEH